jgi:hypothetical protein
VVATEKHASSLLIVVEIFFVPTRGDQRASTIKLAKNIYFVIFTKFFSFG